MLNTKVTENRDSYQRFIDHFHIKKEDLYRFGLEETIVPPIEIIKGQWDGLKNRVDHNQTVSIRGYGRNGWGSHFYLELYQYLFENDHIKIDPTNNAKPHALIEQLTGYKRNKNLFNYQVAHIFGRTKNVFMFEAPWNLALVPKLIDPFTGHEAKGIWPKEYQEQFIMQMKDRYAPFIHEFNELMTNRRFEGKVQKFINDLKLKEGATKEVLQFEKDVTHELAPLH